MLANLLADEFKTAVPCRLCVAASWSIQEKPIWLNS
jgi:hypothetical protein